MLRIWGERRDLNPRSSGPQPDVLTDYTTPTVWMHRIACIGLVSFGRNVVAGPGVEPGLAGPHPAVLPYHFPSTPFDGTRPVMSRLANFSARRRISASARPHVSSATIVPTWRPTSTTIDPTPDRSRTPASPALLRPLTYRCACGTATIRNDSPTLRPPTAAD